jgi:hypothetical protein
VDLALLEIEERILRGDIEVRLETDERLRGLVAIDADGQRALPTPRSASDLVVTGASFGPSVIETGVARYAVRA